MMNQRYFYGVAKHRPLCRQNIIGGLNERMVGVESLISDLEEQQGKTQTTIQGNGVK
jgi:hypothetical protein